MCQGKLKHRYDKRHYPLQTSNHEVCPSELHLLQSSQQALYGERQTAFISRFLHKNSGNWNHLILQESTTERFSQPITTRHQVKDDPRSCERNLYNCVKKPEKNSGLQRGWTQLKSCFFSGFFTQLYKLRSQLRGSSFTWFNFRSSNMNYFIYIILNHNKA